ncbi:MAG: response regulator, partial [Chloroflexota bacterium]
MDKQKGTFVVTSPKVLVVEDSASSSLFITQALQKAGYRVITAIDGNEGLTKALQERPECLILDVVLPGV